MAEVSSGLSAVPALSNLPIDEPSGSTPIENTFNKSNPSKLPENTETENEDRKPPKDSRIPCEYLFTFSKSLLPDLKDSKSPFLSTFQDLPVSYHNATRQIQTKFSLALYFLRVMDTHYIIRTRYLNWTTTLEIRVESASVMWAFWAPRINLYFCSIFFSLRTILTTRPTSPNHSFH